jgi:hypothetical protein
MSKQRKSISRLRYDDPILEHALALVEEYTRKLRAIGRRIRDNQAKYLLEAQELLKQPAKGASTPVKHSPQEQQIWFEVVNGFQSRHQECTEYLRVLVPQATKLAQHVSQLITHGTDQTIIKIELGLRVAELESAIKTSQILAANQLVFLHLD